MSRQRRHALVKAMFASAHARKILHAVFPVLSPSRADHKKRNHLFVRELPKNYTLASHYLRERVGIFEGVGILVSRVTRMRSSIPQGLLMPP